ncbi:hypothetical protein [Luteimonas sp. 3794]|uniref:hypothetical protein n=1 Tax=Luteimonas sp. 3794 TaxID=2817730 RepID=UPI002862ABEF|nr:hypothetical protein [Luteimonas sp. 3794]MDR6990641.1 hypothetical protein [Luteimonas sp. 3794]
MLIVAMAALTISGCDSGQSATPPTPPAGASAYRGDASTTAAQLAMTDLRLRLKASYPDRKWDISRYSAEASMAWEQVRQHYADTLGTVWEVQVEYDGAAAGYRSAAWREGDRIVAIAWQAPIPPDSQPVLTVFLSGF